MYFFAVDVKLGLLEVQQPRALSNSLLPEYQARDSVSTTLDVDPSHVGAGGRDRRESRARVLAYLPVESVIREQQNACYEALALSDKAAEATHFVEFMLSALRQALAESASLEQASEQASEQVGRLLQVLAPGEALRGSELMHRLQLSSRPTFSKNYLKPALAAGVIEMTDPASPRSPAQRYRRRLAT